MKNQFIKFVRKYVPIASVLLVLLVPSCTKEKPGAADKVTIKIAHFWGDSQELWQQVINEFEASHPNIHVEQQVLSFNMHVQKVLTGSAASSDVGDLILFEDWFVQELLDRDYLVDLQPYIDKSLGDTDTYPIAYTTFRSKDKHVRAFPLALGSYPLYYNKNMFDDAHIKYPDSTWTYDTLLAVAKLLTKDVDGDGKRDQYGLLLDNSGGFDGFIHSNGGSILTSDLQSGAMSTPETMDALTKWVNFVRVDSVAPQSASLLGGTSSGGSLRPFETGKFGMALLGSFLSFYKNTQFAWDIAVPPRGVAGIQALRFAQAFGIPLSSKHPAEAWEFLRWIVKDMPAKYADRLFFGLLPNSKRLANSPEYLGGTPKVNRAVIMDMIQNHSFSYWRSKWLEFRDHGFLPELDRMIAGEKTVAAGAADADRAINTVLHSR